MSWNDFTHFLNVKCILSKCCSLKASQIEFAVLKHQLVLGRQNNSLREWTSRSIIITRELRSTLICHVSNCSMPFHKLSSSLKLPTCISDSQFELSPYSRLWVWIKCLAILSTALLPVVPSFTYDYVALFLISGKNRSVFCLLSFPKETVRGWMWVNKMKPNSRED